jgi:hypothetical protein
MSFCTSGYTSKKKKKNIIHVLNVEEIEDSKEIGRYTHLPAERQQGRKGRGRITNHVPSSILSHSLWSLHSSHVRHELG